MSRLGQDATLDRTALREAARWMAQFASGEAGRREHQACAAWRAADPANEAAWRRAEHLFADLRGLPAPLARRSLDRPRSAGRRAALRGLLGLAVTAPVGGWLYQRSRIDHRTATGERLLTALPGGGELLLDTATEVRIEQAPGTLRVHLLAGRIRVDGGARADLQLQARAGLLTLQPATRLAVDDTGEGSLLAVEQGEVGFAADSRYISLRSGLQQRLGTRSDAGPSPLDDAALGWIHGLLYADDQPLDSVLQQLARYRSGWLRCDPAVAAWRISGVFPTTDTDHALAVLARTLPLRISRHGPWTRVLAR